MDGAPDKFHELRSAYLVDRKKRNSDAWRFMVSDLVKEAILQAGMREDCGVRVKMSEQPGLVPVFTFKIFINSRTSEDHPENWTNQLILLVTLMDGVPGQIRVEKHTANTDPQMLKPQVNALIRLLCDAMGWRYNR